MTDPAFWGKKAAYLVWETLKFIGNTIYTSLTKTTTANYYYQLFGSVVCFKSYYFILNKWKELRILKLIKILKISILNYLGVQFV